MASYLPQIRQSSPRLSLLPGRHCFRVSSPVPAPIPRKVHGCRAVAAWKPFPRWGHTAGYFPSLPGRYQHHLIRLHAPTGMVGMPWLGARPLHALFPVVYDFFAGKGEIIPLFLQFFYCEVLAADDGFVFCAQLPIGLPGPEGCQLLRSDFTCL